MRPDIKEKKYMNVYMSIAKLYEENPSIPKVCKQLNISAPHYYHICRVLGKPSVASAEFTPVQEGAAAAAPTPAPVPAPADAVDPAPTLEAPAPVKKAKKVKTPAN